MNLLIIGGDSRISKRLVKVFPDALLTSRRKELSANYLFLELSDVNNFAIPDDIDCCVIAGGPISYSNSVSDYDLSFYIHHYSIPRLLFKLLEKGIYTIYLSSNMVFGPSSFERFEFSRPEPSIPYGQLKYACEQRLSDVSDQLGLQHLFSILRLTKHISPETSPFDKWIISYRKKDSISPFSDLFFAPITYEHACFVISKLLKLRQSGLFHYSGQESVSYQDFLDCVNSELTKRSMLIFVSNPCRSSDTGISLQYNDSKTHLDMLTTNSALSISSLPLNDVVNYFVDLLR
jgi:dTDP-4-dehydrorhamnose reductase